MNISELSQDEKELLFYYRLANAQGKQMIEKIAEINYEETVRADKEAKRKKFKVLK